MSESHPTTGQHVDTTTQAENEKRMAADAQHAGRLKTSRTGAVMGIPDAEHGAYGMRRDGAPGADTATEREIRGVAPDEPAPKP